VKSAERYSIGVTFDYGTEFYEDPEGPWVLYSEYERLDSAAQMLLAALRKARANALILAHSYTHDNTPPSRAVAESLAYGATEIDLAERFGAK